MFDVLDEIWRMAILIDPELGGFVGSEERKTRLVVKSPYGKGMKSSILILSAVLFALAHFAQAKPNLVFLLTDDQALISMGCYGNDEVQTPNLDALAKAGMVFDRHYDTTAICMASRANIMTGMFEYKTGTNFDHGAMVRTHWEKSYPLLLQEAGYRTGFAGKFGFEVTEQPGKKGKLPEGDFDVWGGGPGQTHYETKKNKSMAKYAKEYPHATLSYGAFGSDFIASSVEAKKPFCLSISFKASHRPVTPDPKFDHIYKGKKFTKPANYGRKHGAHFSEQSKQGRQYERFESWGYSDNYDEVMALYYQQIYGVDVAVGMIRDALEANGVADDTVVIFTSDNGFFNGSHGYGSKVLPYEESSRVPLLMYIPGHKNSGEELRCDALTGKHRAPDRSQTRKRFRQLEQPRRNQWASTNLADSPHDRSHSPLVGIDRPAFLAIKSARYLP